ncbi:MAG: hypothetical protein AB8G14_01645 [Ilumatobacter sp.]
MTASTPGATIEHPTIVWNATHGAAREIDHEWANPVPDRRDPLLAAVLDRFDDFGNALTKTTFNQQHGVSPMETARFVSTAGPNAADVLARIRSLEWEGASCAGSMSLGPFRVAETELGTPWLAQARLHHRRARDLDVSVAILPDGPVRCRIEVRPEFRRPWTIRRLRRCLQTTHAAADRLRELVLSNEVRRPSIPIPLGNCGDEWSPESERGRNLHESSG